MLKQMNQDRRRNVLSVIIAIALASIIRNFVIGLYRVPSGSMIPTLNINNYLMGSIIAYKISEPERGDVVIFKYPISERPHQKTVRYVKRLVGMPGDKVCIKDNQLLINDQALEEPYIAESTMMPDFGPIVVPEGQYFMMGDNRNHSNDSRYWGFVDRKYIIAKGMLVYWPFNQCRVIH